MKTTIDIADGLLNDARQVAQREGTSVRALIEQGLRKVLEERGQSTGFRLRKASVKGKGLTPEAATANWEELRHMIYEDRGA